MKQSLCFISAQILTFLAASPLRRNARCVDMTKLSGVGIGGSAVLENVVGDKFSMVLSLVLSPTSIKNIMLSITVVFGVAMVETECGRVTCSKAHSTCGICKNRCQRNTKCTSILVLVHVLIFVADAQHGKAIASSGFSILILKLSRSCPF